MADAFAPGYDDKEYDSNEDCGDFIESDDELKTHLNILVVMQMHHSKIWDVV